MWLPSRQAELPYKSECLEWNSGDLSVTLAAMAVRISYSYKYITSFETSILRLQTPTAEHFDSTQGDHVLVRDILALYRCIGEKGDFP